MSLSDREAARADSTRELLRGRYDEAFPVLTASEVGRLRQYGSVRTYADAQASQGLYEARQSA
jgi:hypothetical protein